MKTEEMLALPCTRRAMRELVDGTLRVQIDIEPMYKQRFMQLMGEIDLAVAITPLQYAPVAEPVVEEAATLRESSFKDYGRLAQSAILMCKNDTFQKFAAECMPGPKEIPTEKLASQFIKLRCQVASRKELDSLDGASTRFGALMAEYREWQR